MSASQAHSSERVCDSMKLLVSWEVKTMSFSLQLGEQVLQSVRQLGQSLTRPHTCSASPIALKCIGCIGAHGRCQKGLDLGTDAERSHDSVKPSVRCVGAARFSVFPSGWHDRVQKTCYRRRKEDR